MNCKTYKLKQRALLVNVAFSKRTKQVLFFQNKDLATKLGMVLMKSHPQNFVYQCISVIPQLLCPSVWAWRFWLSSKSLSYSSSRSAACFWREATCASAVSTFLSFSSDSNFIFSKLLDRCESSSFSCLISLDAFSSFSLSWTVSFLRFSNSSFEAPALLLKLISFWR